MKTKILLSILFISIFIINFISAVPPVTTISQFPSGYLVTEQHLSYIQYNKDVQYNFFVQNSSNGVEITNETINCSFFLADNTGNVIYATLANYNYSGFWFVKVAKGNLTTIGEHPYGVKCKDGLGGSLSGTIFVSSTGIPKEDFEGWGVLSVTLLLIALIFIFGFLGLKLLGNDILWPLGVLLCGLTLILITYSLWFLYEIRLTFSTDNSVATTTGIIFYIFLTAITAGVGVALTLLFTKFKKIKEWFKNIKEEAEREEAEDDSNWN